MVNAQRILELADYIEAEKHGFTMETWIEKQPMPEGACGTAACIAGHAALKWPEFLGEENQQSVRRTELSRFLALTAVQAESLFLPEDFYDSSCYDDERVFCCFADTGEPILYSDLTRAGATATLRRLAASGRVEWFWKEQI